MKKFLIAAIFIFCATLQVEAKDVWVANKGEGLDFYVVTETFQKYSDTYFKVDVKITYPEGAMSRRPVYTGRIESETYACEFYCSDSEGWTYKTEQTGRFDPVKSNFQAFKVCQYCLNNLF